MDIQQEKSRPRPENNKIGGLEYDTIRETINTSIADSREEEQTLIRELTRTRERVHEQYINSSEEVRTKYRGNAKRVDSNAKEYQQQRDRRVSELETIARDNTISAYTNSGTISTVAERFKQSVGTFIERVQERAREMYQSVSQGFGLSR
jgi:DNA anti-recombination protein RmuC